MQQQRRYRPTGVAHATTATTRSPVRKGSRRLGDLGLALRQRRGLALDYICILPVLNFFQRRLNLLVSARQRGIVALSLIK